MPTSSSETWPGSRQSGGRGVVVARGRGPAVGRDVAVGLGVLVGGDNGVDDGLGEGEGAGRQSAARGSGEKVNQDQYAPHEERRGPAVDDGMIVISTAGSFRSSVDPGFDLHGRWSGVPKQGPMLPGTATLAESPGYRGGGRVLLAPPASPPTRRLPRVVGLARITIREPSDEPGLGGERRLPDKQRAAGS